MKTPSRKEAAVLARLDTAGDAENRREHWWHLMPARDRGRALQLAGLDKDRAINPLATFTDAEREKIRRAVDTHVHNMGLILHALQARNTNIHGYLH
jgi:hypothetical protein